MRKLRCSMALFSVIFARECMSLERCDWVCLLHGWSCVDTWLFCFWWVLYTLHGSLIYSSFIILRCTFNFHDNSNLSKVQYYIFVISFTIKEHVLKVLLFHLQDVTGYVYCMEVYEISKLYVYCIGVLMWQNVSVCITRECMSLARWD